MQSITISPQRQLGDILIDCTVEEDGTDTLTITSHPIEKGAKSSDHAFMEPVEVTLQIGFSNSSEQAEGDEGYVRRKYDELQALQRSRVPFDVVTGKRLYTNMLIRALRVRTDQTTEAMLACSVTCREVITVETQVSAVPPTSVQSDPKRTAAPTNVGTVQPQPASLSPGPDGRPAWEDDGLPAQDVGAG